MPIIHSIETFGTHEGPGIRVVFFMQGCKMRCLYCHNPDTIPQKGGQAISKEAIIETVGKSKAYFGSKGGVTFSGGECLIQAAELIPVFEELKKQGIHIAVDTNGFIFDADVERLIELTDLVLLDIKHLDNDLHRKLTGVSNEPVLAFAHYLEQKQKPFWIRHVLLPGWTDDETHLNALGKYFQDFKALERFEILPYHTLGVYKWKEMGWDYELAGVEPPSKEALEKAKALLENYLGKVLIRR